MDALTWGLLLLGAALAILLVEAFVPTAGVLGVTAVVVAIAGVVCLFRAGLNWGLSGMTAVLIGGPTIFLYGLKIYRKTELGRKMTSADADDVVNEQKRREDEALQERMNLIGSEAIVVTELRPIGVVKIGEKRFDAMSETTIIKAGVAVRVTGADANQLRVRAVS
jgi:membrane-bound ClpP family serine protease